MTSPLESCCSVPGCAGRRLLVVEPDVFSCKSLTRVLCHLGFDAVGVRDAADGADRLIRQSPPFDLVICDPGRPGGAGTMILAAVARSGLPIRVVGVSGHAWPEDAAAGLAAGLAEYLVKPITVGGLEAAVHRALTQ
jgi:DNA-binding NtrC family response regulator